MRRTLIGLAILLLSLVGCLHTPIPWSPDGSWIAYTVEVRPIDQIIGARSLFLPVRVGSKAAPILPVCYRLWATQATTNASVLLEESVGPLTAPGWSPDGHALAFGKVVTDPAGPSRFEVVIVEGLTRRRVVSTRPLAVLDSESHRLPHQAIGWSPDGRYLAVPQLDPMGLAIIRVDNGRTVNFVADAFFPSWAPSGGRLAFYVRNQGHSLQYMDSAIGQPRPLIDVGQANQAPSWTRDGTSIYLVAQRGSSKPAHLSDTSEFLRIQLRGDNFTVEPVHGLRAEPGLNPIRVVEGASIAFDRDATNFFCSLNVEGQPHQVTWYRPEENAIYKKFPLVDQALTVGSLSFSPDNRTLAARTGSVNQLAYPVLCDTEAVDMKIRLVTPDDHARLEWIAQLADTARTILAELPTPQIPTSPGHFVRLDRPILLPVQTEFAANSEAASRLRRIGKLGRPLCDRSPESDSDMNPRVRKTVAEARLFFDYLREDYGAALTTLASLEQEAETPERRLALMTIRAQILLNQGQISAARRVISFLDQIEGSPERRVEWDGTHYQTSETFQNGRGWPRFLAEEAGKLQKTTDDSIHSEVTPVSPANRRQLIRRPPGPVQPPPILMPQMEGMRLQRPQVKRIEVPRGKIELKLSEIPFRKP